MGDDTARLPVEIRDDILVPHVQHDAGRQNAPPMRHQTFIGPVVPPEFTEIVGVGLSCREQRREAGEAGIDGIAVDVDDARIRQGPVDEPGEKKIGRHLVGDALRRWRASQRGKIAAAELMELVSREARHDFRETDTRRLRSRQTCHGGGEIR